RGRGGSGGDGPRSGRTEGRGPRGRAATGRGGRGGGGARGSGVRPRVSVLIVSYRSRDSLAQCLPSLAACRDRIPLEVIVVDNDSGDGTVEWIGLQHPWVQVIASDRNLGYASGVDRAAERAGGAALLVLNPDCVVPRPSLE